MKVMPRRFLVRVDKKLMKEKKTLPGGIIVPDTDETGRYALQYGEILQVGELNGSEFANHEFPEAKAGDTIIIHHWAETDETLIINEDENFVYLAIYDDFNNIKGVQKPDGTIIPHPEEIWCLDVSDKDKTGAQIENLPGNWKVGPSGLFVFDGEFNDENVLREKLDDLEYESKYMAQQSDNFNPVIAEKIAANRTEGEQLTNRLNKPVVHELELEIIHPETEKMFSGIKKGDRLFVQGWSDVKGYGLNFKGKDYILCKKESVLYGLKK